eukprot:TRINITY_DN635_c0_g1_i2.p1 TRINITY_DN635_c0_g1~~TRINITY_DN635_c0_g1_i2.p1  ORF type:complete len:553 (-),score=156.18 TRINITY_DN635_c0_g1_i2:308-1966(-)
MERGVIDMLEARLDALLQKDWLADGFDVQGISEADGEQAAADLPATTAELNAIKRALYFFPLQTKVSGLRCLRAAAKTLEQRLEALDGALKAGHKHKRLCVPVTAAAAVLNDSDLLARIMRYLPGGHWIYVAPVSRTVGAAYMAHVVSTYGIAHLFLTTEEAVMQTTDTLFQAAAVYGFDAEIEYVSQRYLSRLAGESGSFRLVHHACNWGLRLTYHVLIGAARHCNLSLLQSIYDDEMLDMGRVTQREWCRVAMALAASGDDGFVLTWLSQQRRRRARWPRYLLAAMCYSAAFNGHLATLQYLLHLRRGVSVFGPFESPPLEVGDDSDSHDSDSDSGGDALDELLLEARWRVNFNGAGFNRQFTLKLMDKAAGSGSIEVLEWLTEEGFEFSHNTMPYAARHGRVAALQWLRQQDCPHDMDEVYEAAVTSHFATPALMQWIRTYGGGDWTPYGLNGMLRFAMIYHKHPAVAEWLRAKKGAEWPDTLFHIFYGYLNRNDISSPPRVEMIAWAAAKGCPWGTWAGCECRTLSSESHSPNASQLLHEVGCECPHQ